MDENSASRTALSTSLMRAIHTRRDPKPLIRDPWGDLLVPAAARERIYNDALAQMDAAARTQAMRHPDSIVDDFLARSRPYANVIARSKFTEDALATAVTAGVGQYVLLGAGFDSFVLRRPPFAAALQIYEIDHPATQRFKLERIQACGFELPQAAHFIEADLGEETVQSALGKSDFRSDQKAFFSWLGVTMYLSREANLATFRSVAASAPAGSQLAFTYLDQRAFDTPSPGFERMLSRLTTIGEPFLSGFYPETLARDLADCGLELVEDLGDTAIAARYGQIGEASALSTPGHSHIALARAGRCLP